MKIRTSLSILLLSSSVAYADPKVSEVDKMTHVPSWKILRVVDGDTVKVILPESPDIPAQLREMSIRIYGVDTPEKGGRAKCAQEAALGRKSTQFAKDIVDPSSAQIYVLQHDKFGGRVDGDIVVNGVPLSKILIDNGLAHEYYGDTKKSWCD
ncbi:nuclease SNase-like protein [Rhizobium phage RHph_TM39]|uniref:Nuclease SNase-like protein n=2 Tax=Cuauhnahuacvirus TaxID=3044696 RepID=A0A7S5RH63_9CAUD|nr:endonuclease [Rhizobium phage RHph_TM30]YP_010671360.1 endonuclease [Rhizobium phage RHph_Y65]QIG71681.1 nuclease SNase-like protein [Rhizobium phage RHph_TM40]QIG72044.1 nuclease SNase-like protein [Rhizobium phage RHph_TM2_3B]QIG72407.1 nuclease SNase-like protein [Rhizobium phage RHph_TM3_3_6]QIG77189.1 nuclease SNase-like protein [Rhizobium phage RHph_TM39]QIG77509.1 nuclease SNase-like protein [Rhizobium phage RHph_TM21B]QIG77797.1 nuclease SNase-like protein [Rhizobium phage RHph_TM